MHLLRPGEGAVDDGSEAVDLGQPSGDVVILSFADTELLLLADAVAARGPDAPSVRLANLKLLRHPMSVDLYLEQTLSAAKLIVVRALGGAAYWSYGIEEVARLARGAGIRLAVVPGDPKDDPSLDGLSTIGEQDRQRIRAYFDENGADNMAALLGFADHLLGHAKTAPEPKPMPRFGRYPAPTPDAPTGKAALVFYRSLLESGSLAPVDSMIAALGDKGLDVLPLFVSSLKAADDAAFVTAALERHQPDVVVNLTSFAVSNAGEAHQPTPLDACGAPVLQAILSSQQEPAWAESLRGLSPRDLAMSVVMPEVDGRITTRAIAFKSPASGDPALGGASVRSVPNPERVAFVAALAANWARLRRTPAVERRVALVLANYPNRDGRLANGVGLDTPASAVAILQAMANAGYALADAPETSGDLMERLIAGQTNAPGKGASGGTVAWPLAAYDAAFSKLPTEVQTAITERWGAPEADPFVRDGAFHLPAHRMGNATLMVQPARGYNLDPKATCHDPDLVPPHGYLAAYLWLRHGMDTHAVIHVGKHGTLEWLPGKAIALGETCFPDAVFGPLPHFYPFIVNDPGEGAQAKRRSQAVIIDHMTPPMARAEAHGVSLELEALLDEFAQAEAMDPARAASLKADIFDLAQASGIDRDAGAAPGDPDALVAIDTYLCDLKELQIRDGLHILGISPDGAIRAAHLTALARVPRFGGEAGGQSLHRAIAADLDLDGFDPLDCAPADPWTGPRPDVLAAMDGTWRTHGDTVERIEMLAEDLVSGAHPFPEDWTETRAVLDWITTDIGPALDACGDAEISAILTGLDGRFVPPGPSGAPTRGRPDVLPTGRNFYAVDVRAVPSRTAWALGQKSADTLVTRYFQDEGEWPKAMVLSAWGTSNMRTGGDDIAQALALIGAKPVWDTASARVSGYEIIPLSELGRPRVDVTLRISGFFRDAFPQLVHLFDTAARAIGALDEPDEANPIKAAMREGNPLRIFGAKPGAYGAGLQTLIDEGVWRDRSDFAESFLVWGGYGYSAREDGIAARAELENRLTASDAVIHNQDNREHDLLDSDDYYQFEGGLAATVEHLKGEAPRVYHNDHSRPERPVVRSLDEEIARVVRGRAANPKWIAGVMRHGYKGAFEMAATVDYLYAFAATTDAVHDHHFDQLFDAYLADDAVRAFIAQENAPALAEMAARFADAIERNLWAPRLNSARETLDRLAAGETLMEDA